MAGVEVNAFVSALCGRLSAVGADSSDLAAFADAAEQIASLLDQPSGTVAQNVWASAAAQFEQARRPVLSFFAEANAGALADFPSLRNAFGSAETIARTGLRAAFDLGPVHVSANSGVFYVTPPTLAGGVVPAPIPIGPFALGALEASIASPLGGGGPSLPGGGSLTRLWAADGSEAGWGGGLELPLPPVLVSATALLSMEGTSPSFLAVLGVQFTPPIQLSFGFSLDRVGGLVGVDRMLQVEALRAAIRTGAAADALFQVRPPANPSALATTLDSLFPRRRGEHLLGPSLKLSWLSFGAEGALVSLDLAVILEIPVGRVSVIGSARMGIPSLPALLNLRLDMLGLVDPLERLVSIDASLVDSDVLGVFEVYGDAALRMSWGSQPYVVASVGGFFPGFDPKPAKLPALRRVGMSQSTPGTGLTLRIEGYFAATSNSIQLGGRIEASIDLVISAHGVIEADALVQFRPFHFQAQIAAGFSVSVDGHAFGSVQLHGQISGPGPIVVHGALSISIFLFEISWDQTFSLGSGPRDPIPLPAPLLDMLAEVLGQRENLRTANTSDPEVVLAPRPAADGFAVAPPTGSLQVAQRLAPLGIPLDRVAGLPLASKQGAALAGVGADVLDGFAPGSFLNLTDSEILNRKPFEDLPAGKVLTPPDPDLAQFPKAEETGTVRQIVIDTRTGARADLGLAGLIDLGAMSALTLAARAAPALSDRTPVLQAVRESWVEIGSGAHHASATAALEFGRLNGTAAVPAADLAEPVAMAGVFST